MADQAIYCIMPNKAKAEKLVQALIDAGIPANDISFLSAQEDWEQTADYSVSDTNRNWRTEDRVTEHVTEYSDFSDSDLATSKHPSGGLGTEKHTKAPEGAAAGATTGGIIGGTLGLLTGIGALAIPGLGPFIAAGPLMATLSGIGLGGAVGGLTGSLIGAGMSKYLAKRYETKIAGGNVLVAVKAPSNQSLQNIENIMKKYQAEDISTSAEVLAKDTPY